MAGNKKEVALTGVLSLFSEFLENGLEGLDDAELSLTGIPQLAKLLKSIGAADPRFAHGLDIGLRMLIRTVCPHPVWKDFLVELSDAYFDKTKDLLGKEVDEKQELQARLQGADKARAKLREFVKKQTAKSTFAAMLTKLGVEERSSLHEWVHWMKISDAAAFKEWNTLKEQIGSVDELREIVECGDNANMIDVSEARLSYLRMAYGREQTMLEAAKAFLVDGVKTPQIEKLEAKIAENIATANAKADEWAAKAAALRNRNRR